LVKAIPGSLIFNSSDFVILTLSLSKGKVPQFAAKSRSFASLRMTNPECVVGCFVSGHRFSDAASVAKSAPL